MCAVGTCGCSIITEEVRNELFRMFIEAHDRSSPIFNYSSRISYKRMPKKGFTYLDSDQLSILSGLTGLQGEELFNEIRRAVHRVRQLDELYSLKYQPEEDINHEVTDENVFAIYFWVNVDLLEFSRRAA